MKNIKKYIPVVATLALLVGCSTTPKLNSKDTPVIKTVEQSAFKDSDTYQNLFDDLYEENGVNLSVDELIVRVSKFVLLNSGHWTSEQIASELDQRVVEHFNTFYSAANKEDGLFREIKLVNTLESQGFNITKGEAEAFEETVDNLVGHTDLIEKLAYDYSAYINELKVSYYKDLLNEEYVRDQRAGSSTTYFKNKDVRKVEYFTYTPENSADASKYAQLFQDAVDASITNGEDFKTLVTKADGLEYQWKLSKLEALAKEFAIINKVAFDGGAVNNNEEYPLPASYKEAVASYEAKYVNDSNYGFKNIYTKEGKALLDDSEISSAKAKLSEYSNSGKQSIYKGYYDKQVAIITASYFSEVTFTSDTGNVINSKVASALEDWKTSQLYNESNYLDVNETGTVVYKDGSNYYIIHATQITDSSSDADIKLACKQLASSTSNVRNAIYYYLTKLTEEGKLSIHNQDVYDYLNSTYNYGNED